MKKREKKNRDKKDKIAFKQALTNNFYIFKLAYSISPKRVWLAFIFNIFGYLLDYYYSIIFMATIFKVISDELPFKIAVIMIVINMIVIFIFNIFSSRYFIKIIPETNLLFQEKLNLMIFNKAADIELECYENSEFYNKYTRAGSEANNRITEMLDNMSRIVGLLVSMIMIFITIIDRKSVV